MIDVHEYQVFSNGEVAMSWDQHIATACSKRSQYSSFHLWTVVGEWSTAFTDCAAKNPNATSTGARYDGTYPGSSRIGDCTPWTGNGNAFSSDYKTFLRKFWEAQVTGGHCLLILSRGRYSYKPGSVGGGKWLDLLDVEARERGRMELPSRSQPWVDSVGS